MAHPYRSVPLPPISLILTAGALYLHARYGLLIHLAPTAFYTIKLGLHYAVENGALVVLGALGRTYGAALRERWNTVLGLLMLGSGFAAVVCRVLVVWWGILGWIFGGYTSPEEVEEIVREPVYVYDQYGRRYEEVEDEVYGVVLVQRPATAVVYEPAGALMNVQCTFY